MLDKLKKIKEFYLNLPDNIILEASENADFNRQIKRELKKLKTIKTKLQFILGDEIKHKKFIEYINTQFNDINNNYNNINEVLNSLNNSNFMKSMIYMLENYYLTNEFNDYILSNTFNEDLECFMKGDSIKNEKKDDNMINDKENMNKCVVTIEEKNGFFNIYPLFRVEDDKLIKLQVEDYPDYGNINVNPRIEFSKKDYSNKCSLWICRFDQSLLEETQNKTRFKIDGDKLIKDKNIYSINEEGIYEIVELLEDNSVFEELIYNDNIEIKTKPILEKIYIRDNNYIYGPFGYVENNRGGGYFIDKTNSNYIIEKYPIKENDEYLSISEIETPDNYSKAYITVVYFHNKKSLISEKVDIISKEELFSKLKEVISIKNTCYSKNEIEEIRKNIDFIIDNSLSEERRNRIKALIKNTEITEEFIKNDFIDIIGVLLDSKDTKEVVANKILSQHEILRKLQNVELVQAKIDSKNQELEDAKQELESTKQELKKIQLEIKDDNKNANNKNMQELIEQNQTEIKEMTDERVKIGNDIDKLAKKYKLYKEIDLLKEEIKELKKEAEYQKEDYNVFSRQNEKRKAEVENIEQKIRGKLDSAISKYPDIAFDGMIANEMLESAAKWNKKKYVESFENAIASKENVEKVIKVKSFEVDNIIEYIYNKIAQNRDYSRNDVINIMICLTQGFLTVFAGEPGVGKTSICSIIAKALGLSNKNSDYNRFTEISVEKGWSSKRDLIGYYNPLTKLFDKNNSLLFKTFNILHQECIKEINDFPYYVLLDEANLSSMEHYWADFMNVCDFDKENRKINLGEDYIYNIPKTLRFLATINYDHTTETLSPRLVDRAWIILLEGNSCGSFLDNDQEQQTSEEIIMFKDLEKCFSYSSYYEVDEELPNQMYKELDGIYSMFKTNSMSISPRIDNMIKRYLKVGCKLFKETESTAQEFIALDYAVAQKLLPKINGYGDEYKAFLQAIEERFDKNNMMRCKNITTDIIKKGDTNMQYYQFFG
ncbi:hypothetical protein LGL55_04770 [Clostridium tagluense]|uniref:hypothetical protein n=1 Tax=Clostridium tagluense TaxID=360422 RepID=UPI001CF4CF24|nr:hypothetical protein [Clostridium tagluense]MCB2310433.1 hypothetical protein [Clostridium tagluense]MCB2315401.1 hypothetical protein [Clostridium tagluense]MCB2320253.1 hypothetical protein [Clostridium tagluense]MCB2325143.1 hypothetical protein [Clostridium tagluense]MCB2329995.1 hypothetical protein [Clostridium tagluense]